jgi:hypothetical protein
VPQYPDAQLLSSLQPQPPPTQALPAGSVLQSFPHKPQFGSTVMSVSQPFVSGAVWSQSPKPATQLLYWHTPLLQLEGVLCDVLQASPQPPQFDKSLAMSISQPSLY